MTCCDLCPFSEMSFTAPKTRRCLRMISPNATFASGAVTAPLRVRSIWAVFPKAIQQAAAAPAVLAFSPCGLPAFSTVSAACGHQRERPHGAHRGGREWLNPHNNRYMLERVRRCPHVLGRVAALPQPGGYALPRLRGTNLCQPGALLAPCRRRVEFEAKGGRPCIPR